MSLIGTHMNTLQLTLEPEYQAFLTNIRQHYQKAQLEFTVQAVPQLPWGHIVVLIQQVKDSEAREWYAQSVLKNGTSRNVLIMQIEQNLYERQGKIARKVTKFAKRLLSPQSTTYNCHFSYYHS